MTIYVPFDEIHLLELDEPVTYETPFGSLPGTVHHLVPGQYLAIANGKGAWRICAEHMSEGLLTKPEHLGTAP